MGAETRTGGREATTAIDPGRFALSIGLPARSAPAGWQWTRLTQVARLETGHTPSRKHPEYWGGDVPWIGIKDATHNDGRRINDTLQKTTAEGIENSSARLLPRNTVCLSRTASVGYVVVMGREMATSQDFVNWVCDPEGLDWRILKWALLAEREALRRWSHGTTHQTIYFPEVKAFHICLPGRSEQTAIADVLGALDDKIESNRRLADAVDDVCLMAFEDAERGAVETLALEDFVAFNQLSWSARRHPAEIDYVDISSLQPRRITTIQRVYWSDAPSRARRVVRSGDTIISTVRPERRALAFVDAASAELTASTGFAVLTPISVSPTYAYFAATSERATNFFAGAATGSAYPAVRADAMKTFAIRVPADRGEQFEELARPLLSMARSVLAEIRTVAAIRDALLPKLVSGQIRVPLSNDVNEQIGVATEALA